MKSKKYLYVVTILFLLYSFAFFQTAFTQSNCNNHGFKPVNIDLKAPYAPRKWYFISPDTALLLVDDKYYLFHDLRSENPKVYQSALLTKRDSVNEEKWSCTGISFANSKLGYVSATQDIVTNNQRTFDGGVFKTTDGGLSWKYIDVDFGFGLLRRNGIQFFTIRNNIFYALSVMNLIQSKDEGKTWSLIGQIKFDNYQNVNNFCFIDDTTIVAGGYHAIVKSTDGGKTWKTKLNLYCTINSILFFGNKRGFAVGTNASSCTYQTEDGGETWQWTNLGLPSRKLSNVAYLYKVNDSTAYGTGVYMKSTCNYIDKDTSKISTGFLARTFDAGKTWKFFYNCPIAKKDFIPLLNTTDPTFVWASDEPDSSVFIYARTKILYGGHGGEYTNIDDTRKDKSIPNFRIYPNPATHQFTIESSEGIKKVLIYDSMGKRVLFKESSWENAMKIDVQDFPHGIYLLQVETDGGSVTQRVVVE